MTNGNIKAEGHNYFPETRNAYGKTRYLSGQGGYLYEIPLMVILAAVFFSVVYPCLGEPWNHLLLGGLVIIFLFFIFYNCFAAGWQPGRTHSDSDKTETGEPGGKGHDA